MMVDGQNPYRGPFSYKESDEDIFFGRNLEVEELTDFIRKNQLTVLYGASGTGKTSLIHAKLLPQLKREYFHPIYIRINFANKNEDPLHFIQKRIVEELRIWDKQIPDFQPGQSLIHYAAKNVIFKGLIKPVLFFDQFEELFTLGPKTDPYKIHRFMFQLSELIELRLPDDLKTLDYINNISSFKVVFSLRQDWIGFLDDFSQLIPSINEVRFRLKKFSPAQAMEAIMGPSQSHITPEAAQEIIRTIGTDALWREDNLPPGYLSRDLINKEIDPFVLSLYCFKLYDKCIQQGLSQISTEFVRENKDTQLIRNYYEEKIEKYPEIRHLIEDKLLNESGKRLIVPLDRFTSGKEHLEEVTHKAASETGIVRVIGMGNESEIEIVHDRLALRIFDSKRERTSKELLEEATKKEREAENLKQSAKKAKKAVFRVSVAAAVIIAALIGVSVYFYIYSLNNNTIGGLRSQLTSEKEDNDKAQDSIKTLNDTIQNLKSFIASTPAGAPDTSSQVTLRKYYNDIIKLKRDTIVSAIHELATLTTSYESLEDNNKMLSDNLHSLQSILRNQPKPPPIVNNEASNAFPNNLTKLNFANPKIDNERNAGGVDFADVRKNGFKFSFNINTAAISSDEKGTIEVRVEYKTGKSSTNYQAMPHFLTGPIFEQGQPIKYVTAVPRDVKEGKAFYTITYFITRGDKTTTRLLESGNFEISKPPLSANP